MENKFYNEFDFERVSESRRGKDYRTPFQIDRDRVIHSSEFRRLQGKTQVFLPGEYDYYRTRLTHSIEVAQIGRSICNFLISQKDSPFDKDFYVDSDLVEAACLAHDLGNPPFGHAGERTINELMNEFGGFEGNAQTLRLLTEILYRGGNDKRGMKPTRALIDGVLKYKALHKQHKPCPTNHFIYDEQKKYLNFVFAPGDLNEEKKTVDELNGFRSLECQIMDWADDTAYGLNDLVDSVSLGFMNVSRLREWRDENRERFSETEIGIIDEVIEVIRNGKYKAFFGSLIGNCIESCSIEERKNFMSGKTNRYKYGLVIDPEIKMKVKMFKKMSIELVFRSPQLHQMEFKGNSMIEKVFEVLKSNYVDEDKKIKLLPDYTDKIIRAEKDSSMKVRMICDYISGMTDAYAVRIYRRLFDPDYGSLIDFI